MPRGEKLLRIAVHVAVILAWVGILAGIISRGLHYQWDLWPFYYGAKAWAAGLDPYSLESLRDVSGEEGDLWFRYPLFTLYLFRLLNLFSYETAWYVWLGLKLVALGGLLVVWRRTFLRDTDGLLMVFAFLLAYNGTVPSDVFTGNKATFEQLMLWFGFAALVRGYLWWFSATTVAASLFNVTPAAFLGLLLGVQERARSITVMASAIVVLLLLLLVPYAVQPELFDSALRAGSSAQDLGMDNPCFLGFLYHCAVLWPSSFVTGKHVSLMLWAVYAAIIISFSVKPLTRAARDGDIRYLIFLAVVTYAVAMPRMMCYAYILLIPPTLLAIHHLFQRFSHRLIAVGVLSLPIRFLFVIPVIKIPSLFSMTSPISLISYYPWLLALVLWGLYISGKVKLAEDKSDAADITVVQ
ncbi:MAG: DUF2029 domain-containing protein [candidate division WS1 bacterium]|jgi:hypothetical protein|nr:DUF2029 domain-containing protein [candidate division WS1 bacterium]